MEEEERRRAAERVKKDLETLETVRKIIERRKSLVDHVMKATSALSNGNINNSIRVTDEYTKDEAWVPVKEKVRRYELMLQAIKEAAELLNKVGQSRGISLHGNAREVIKNLEVSGQINLKIQTASVTCETKIEIAPTTSKAKNPTENFMQKVSQLLTESGQGKTVPSGSVKQGSGGPIQTANTQATQKTNAPQGTVQNSQTGVKGAAPAEGPSGPTSSKGQPPPMGPPGPAKGQPPPMGPPGPGHAKGQHPPKGSFGPAPAKGQPPPMGPPGPAPAKGQPQPLGPPAPGPTSPAKGPVPGQVKGQPPPPNPNPASGPQPGQKQTGDVKDAVNKSHKSSKGEVSPGKQVEKAQNGKEVAKEKSKENAEKKTSKEKAEKKKSTSKEKVGSSHSKAGKKSKKEKGHHKSKGKKRAKKKKGSKTGSHHRKHSKKHSKDTHHLPDTKSAGHVHSDKEEKHLDKGTHSHWRHIEKGKRSSTTRSHKVEEAAAKGAKAEQKPSNQSSYLMKKVSGESGSSGG